jgi:hypothetical protein
MMKWLRLYRKQIMVVLVLLAMLAFVGGNALTSLWKTDRSKQPYAKIFGAQVTSADIYPAQGQVNVLRDFNISWQYDIPDRQMTAVDWYMLAEEADRAGIMVSDEEVDKDMRTRLQDLERMGFGANYLETLRARSNITANQVRQALRRHLAIWKNFSRVADAGQPSEAEVRHYVKETEAKVRVRFVALDAQQFVDETEPLAEADLQAHFEAYKGVDAAASATGFGYRYPPRVRVQYLLASLNTVQPQIAVSEDDVVAYWKKNKADYKKKVFVDEPVATSAPAADPAASQPASQPVQTVKVEREVPKTFTEAQPDIERRLRQKKAEQLMEQAMRKAARELLQPWENTETNTDTGLKPVPAGAEAADFMRTVCDRIQVEFGIPLTYAETPLSSKEELKQVTPLSTATIAEEGEKKLSAVDYAFNVPPFVSPKERRGGGLHLQLYQTPDAPLKGLTLEQTDRGFEQTTVLVLFRVVEALEASAPADLNEVRAQVERDLRLARSFQRLESTASELWAAASRLGLPDAVPLFQDSPADSRIQPPMSPPAFAKRVDQAKSAGRTAYMDLVKAGKPALTPPAVVGVGPSEEFVDACFVLTEPNWQPPAVQVPDGARLQTATTRPAASPVPRVTLLSIPKLKKWFVIESLGLDDVDQNRYELQLRTSSYQALKSDRAMRLHLTWFAPASIQARCGFQRLTGDGATGSDEGLAPPEAPIEPIF